MGWFWNKDKESMFSLSFGTKAILFMAAAGVMFIGIGYALRPVAEIVDELDGDSESKKSDRELGLKNEESIKDQND